MQTLGKYFALITGGSMLGLFFLTAMSPEHRLEENLTRASSAFEHPYVQEGSQPLQPELETQNKDQEDKGTVLDDVFRTRSDFSDFLRSSSPQILFRIHIGADNTVQIFRRDRQEVKNKDWKVEIKNGIDTYRGFVDSTAITILVTVDPEFADELLFQEVIRQTQLPYTRVYYLRLEKATLDRSPMKK